MDNYGGFMQIINRIKKAPADFLLHTQMPLLIGMGLFLFYSLQRDFSVNMLRYYDFYVEAFRSYIGALVLSVMMILTGSLLRRQSEKQ